MHISQLKPDIFFAFEYYPYRDLFHDCIYVWDALKDLPSYIQSVLKPKIHGKVAKLAHVEGPVFIGKGTTVESGAMIKGPAIIGNGCEIRAGAYIRENTLIADGVVIGHASEVKHSILFNQVSVPHFAFVGDSILGQKVHLGAGVRLSNFKITGRPVRFSMGDDSLDTGLLKFGSILGDGVAIGCNSVLNPGTCIGKNTLVCANLSLKGYYGPNLFIKLVQEQHVVERKY